MSDNPMVGLWELVAYVVRFADGRETFPLGNDPYGYIYYSPDGFVSGMMLERDRAHFKTGNRLSASAEEKVRAWDSCVTYMGRYEFQGDRVIHHIKASLYPDWSGDTQPRYYKPEPNGDVSLTAHFEENGVRRDAIVYWRRTTPAAMK